MKPRFINPASWFDQRKHGGCFKDLPGSHNKSAKIGGCFSGLSAPPPPPHYPYWGSGPFLSIPWSGHTLAAGLLGVLKGSEKPSEIVEMLRKEKSWPSEQFGQSLINWKRTSAHEAPTPSQHCVDCSYLTASWMGALILELDRPGSRSNSSTYSPCDVWQTACLLAPGFLHIKRGQQQDCLIELPSEFNELMHTNPFKQGLAHKKPSVTLRGFYFVSFFFNQYFIFLLAYNCFPTC